MVNFLVSISAVGLVPIGAHLFGWVDLSFVLHFLLSIV